MTLKQLLEKRAALLASMDGLNDMAALDKLELELRKLDLLITEARTAETADPAGEARGGQPPAEAGDDPAARTQAVNSNIPGIVEAGQEQRQQPPAEDMEYRKAFMNYVVSGTAIPSEARANQNTKTSDVGETIPTLLVNRIVETMETIGMILPLVTRTAFKGGIEIPTSSVKPVASWVAEGAGSDRQKKTTGKISFTYHKLRCEISMSMEVGEMAISAFETAFVKQVSEAMVKSIEKAIIAGSGSGQPKGILTETPATGQELSIATLEYKTLVDAEAALPQAYEGGAVWCMTKKTFMGFIGMVDTNKQPIARINYGLGGKPERILLGRSVVLCGDYMESFSATLAAGKIFAFLFNFSDYTLNTIYDMGVQRKQDWDTEDLLTKAVMSVDGKVVDKNSLVTLKKSA